jgi:hypothetical protein
MGNAELVISRPRDETVHTGYAGFSTRVMQGPWMHHPPTVNLMCRRVFEADEDSPS